MQALGDPTWPDLTLPEGSTASVRRVLGELLRERARWLGKLPLSRATPALARAGHALVEIVRGELAREPGRVFAALRRPTVSAPLSCLRALGPDAGAGAIDPLLRELTATLAVELAWLGCDVAIELPDTPARVLGLGGRVVLPGGGRASLHSGRWRASGVEIELAEADRSMLLPIEGDIVLALADNNPLAMLEAHPDKEGNALDLGGRTAQAWIEELRADLAVIREHLPLLREEIDLILHQLVPVGYDEQKHLSASYREAIGTVYLTLHPQRMTMVEAVIHEYQHNKLNAVVELDPLLQNPPGELHTSPVRPDPRPLFGILLAVHAFVPVAELYRRRMAIDDPQGRLQERHARIVKGNREGLDVLLAHGRPTAAGRALLEELDRRERESRVGAE